MMGTTVVITDELCTHFEIIRNSSLGYSSHRVAFHESKDVQLTLNAREWCWFSHQCKTKSLSTESVNNNDCLHFSDERARLLFVYSLWVAVCLLI